MREFLPGITPLPSLQFNPLKLLIRTVKLLFEAEAWKQAILLLYHTLPAAWIASSESHRKTDLLALFMYLLPLLEGSPLVGASDSEFFPFMWMLPVLDNLNHSEYSEKSYGRGLFLGYTLAAMVVTIFPFFGKEKMAAFIGDILAASLLDCRKASRELFHDRPRKIVLSSSAFGTLEGFHRLLNIVEYHQPKEYSFSPFFNNLGFWFQYPSFDNLIYVMAPSFSLAIVNSIIDGYKIVLENDDSSVATFPIQTAIMMLCEFCINSHELHIFAYFFFPIIIRLFLQFRIDSAAFESTTHSTASSYLSVFLAATSAIKEKKRIKKAASAITKFLSFSSVTPELCWSLYSTESTAKILELLSILEKLFSTLVNATKKNPIDEEMMRKLLTANAVELTPIAVDKIFSLLNNCNTTEIENSFSWFRFFPQVLNYKDWLSLVMKFVLPLGPYIQKFNKNSLETLQYISKLHESTPTQTFSMKEISFIANEDSHPLLVPPSASPSTSSNHFFPQLKPPPALPILFYGTDDIFYCISMEQVYEIYIQQLTNSLSKWIQKMQDFRVKINELDVLNSSVYIESKFSKESFFECTFCGVKNPANFILTKTSKDERVKECLISSSHEFFALFHMDESHVALMDGYFFLMENFPLLCMNVDKESIVHRLSTVLDRFIMDDLSVWGIYYLITTISTSGSTAKFSLETYGGKNGIMNLKKHPAFEIFDVILFYLAHSLFVVDFDGAKLFIQLITRQQQPLTGVEPIMNAFVPNRYPQEFLEMYRHCLFPEGRDTPFVEILEKFDVNQWIKEVKDPAVVKEFVALLLAGMGGTSGKLESLRGTDILRKHFSDVHHNTRKYSMEAVLENALSLKTDFFDDSFGKSAQKFILESLQSTADMSLNVSTPTFMNAFVKLPSWINQKISCHQMNIECWNLLYIFVENLMKPHPNKANVGEKMELDFVMALFTIFFLHYPYNWKCASVMVTAERFIRLLGVYLQRCSADIQAFLFDRFFIMLLPTVLTASLSNKESLPFLYKSQEAVIADRLLVLEVFLSTLPFACETIEIKECVPSLEALELLHMLSALLFFIRWIGNSKEAPPLEKEEEGLSTFSHYMQFETIITFIENRLTLDLWEDILITPEQHEKYLQLLVFLPLLGHGQPLSNCMQTFLLRWLHLSPTLPCLAEPLFEAHIHALVHPSSEILTQRLATIDHHTFSRWMVLLSSVLISPKGLNPFLFSQVTSFSPLTTQSQGVQQSDESVLSDASTKDGQNPFFIKEDAVGVFFSLLSLFNTHASKGMSKQGLTLEKYTLSTCADLQPLLEELHPTRILFLHCFLVQLATWGACRNVSAAKSLPSVIVECFPLSWQNPVENKAYFIIRQRLLMLENLWMLPLCNPLEEHAYRQCCLIDPGDMTVKEFLSPLPEAAVPTVKRVETLSGDLKMMRESEIVNTIGDTLRAVVAGCVALFKLAETATFSAERLHAIEVKKKLGPFEADPTPSFDEHFAVAAALNHRLFSPFYSVIDAVQQRQMYAHASEKNPKIAVKRSNFINALGSTGEAIAAAILRLMFEEPSALNNTENLLYTDMTPKTKGMENDRVAALSFLSSASVNLVYNSERQFYRCCILYSTPSPSPLILVLMNSMTRAAMYELAVFKKNDSGFAIILYSLLNDLPGKSETSPVTGDGLPLPALTAIQCAGSEIRKPLGKKEDHMKGSFDTMQSLRIYITITFSRSLTRGITLFSPSSNCTFNVEDQYAAVNLLKAVEAVSFVSPLPDLFLSDLFSFSDVKQIQKRTFCSCGQISVSRCQALLDSIAKWSNRQKFSLSVISFGMLYLVVQFYVTEAQVFLEKRLSKKIIRADKQPYLVSYLADLRRLFLVNSSENERNFGRTDGDLLLDRIHQELSHQSQHFLRNINLDNTKKMTSANLEKTLKTRVLLAVCEAMIACEFSRSNFVHVYIEAVKSRLS